MALQAHPDDPSGVQKLIYFYHAESGTSQWERPNLRTLDDRINSKTVSELWLPQVKIVVLHFLLIFVFTMVCDHYTELCQGVSARTVVMWCHLKSVLRLSLNFGL